MQNSKAIYFFFIILLAMSFSISSCSSNNAPESNSTRETPIPVTPGVTSIPPTSTITPIPPTAVPTTIIRLSQITNGSNSNPLLLEVIKGKYKITSGTTLTSGSVINANEEMLTFPSGLVIEIGKGGVTLNGINYPEGTKFIIDANGTPVNELDNSEVSLTNSTPEIKPTTSVARPTSNFSGPAATAANLAKSKRTVAGTPIIQSVSLREDSSSGSKIIFQDISFIDNEGDVTRVDYKIVSSTISGLLVEGGTLDIPSSLQKLGTSFTGEWGCGNESYSVTLEATLTDRANNHSEPYNYTMVCGS